MFTLFAIQNAKPRAKPYKLSDGNGLHLLIERTGSKLWRFRYQFDRTEKMLSLGPFPRVSLASARTKRDDARKLLAEGIDPSQQKKLDKIAAATAANNTFGAIARST
jgi:Arm DNA-binding domain